MRNKKNPFLIIQNNNTDSPFLVELTKDGDSYKAGQLLRANRLNQYKDMENGDWQFLMWDEEENRTKVPKGSVGNRWAKENKGHWNLKLEDNADGSKIHPKLTFLKDSDHVFSVELDDFGQGRTITRYVPVK